MDTSTGPARFGRYRLLRWRLPLLISVLVAAVVATFLWAAYRKAHATLIEWSGQRAQIAADQVAGLLEAAGSTARLRQLATDPFIRGVLAVRTEEARRRALERLEDFARAGRRRVELWDARGSPVLQAAGPANETDGAGAGEIPPAGPPPTAVGIGPLQRWGENVFVEVVAEVRDDGPPARRLGYLRVRTTFVENPPGIFGRLVGHDAKVRIGNRDGTVWTDLTRVVAGAPVDLSRAGVAQYRTSHGEARIGAVSLVRGAPWAVWVGFPLEEMVAPARVFLRGMLVAALLFVGAAAVVATGMASRITRPLGDLNAAAAAIAAGDFSRRVDASRRDEIGELARTFNRMAANIESSAAALRRSEESYRRLFASNPHPMWIYDVDTLRFVDVNDMAVARYGYSRDEFLAMTIKDIRPEADVPALLDNVARLGPATETAGQWRHRRKDGTIVDVEVSSHEMMLGGRRARAVLAHDVTERLKAQRALQEREAQLRALNAELEQRVRARTAELEAANQELESFSYSVSHDLRAPLRHVQGYVEMLASSVEGQLSAKAQRYLNTIADATSEMGQLIDDLLAFSRMARVQLSQEPVALNPLVERVIAGLEPATRGRAITWKIAPLPTVTGDVAMLKQVYANLLDNAVKYTRRRSEATIEIGCAGRQDGMDVLFVRDNGAGFDMRYAHKLFGVFQRLHRPDEFEGTGIGLATVRRIVQRHGGRTWAEGSLDAGATIYFTLKPADASAPAGGEETWIR